MRLLQVIVFPYFSVARSLSHWHTHSLGCTPFSSLPSLHFSRSLFGAPSPPLSLLRFRRRVTSLPPVRVISAVGSSIQGDDGAQRHGHRENGSESRSSSQGRTSRRPALPRHSDRLDGDRDAAPEEHSDSEEPDTGNRWGEAGGVAPGDSMLRRAATHTSSTSIRPFGTSVPSLKSEVRYEWAMPA